MVTDLKVGSNLSIEEIIGAWGGNTIPTKTLKVGVSDKPLQQVFSIPTNESIVLAYTVTVMGETYTDLLVYGSAPNKRDYSFQTRNRVDFYENRTSYYGHGIVCVKTRSVSAAPGIVYNFKVLYSSCSESKITWFIDDEVFVDKGIGCWGNTVVCSTSDSIDKDAETTQILTANSDGTVDGFDMLEHNDYIIDVSHLDSEGEGLLKLTCSDFQHDKIYRMTLNEDVDGIEITAGEAHQKVTGTIPSYTVISIVPYDATEWGSGWQLSIDWQDINPAQSTYTREEIDEKISEKADYIHTHTISDVENLQNTLDGLGDRRVVYDGLINAGTTYNLTSESINTYSMVGVRGNSNGATINIASDSNYNSILFNVHFDFNKVYYLKFQYKNSYIYIENGGLYYAYWENDTLYMHQLSQQKPLNAVLTIDLSSSDIPTSDYYNNSTYQVYKQIKFTNSTSASSSKRNIRPNFRVENAPYCVSIENADTTDITITPTVSFRANGKTSITTNVSTFTIEANTTSRLLITEMGIIEL